MPVKILIQLYHQSLNSGTKESILFLASLKIRVIDKHGILFQFMVE